MKCTSCGADIQPGASFCSKCGTRLDELQGDAPVSSPQAAGSKPERTNAEVAETSLRAGVGRRDEPEEELWQGSYSVKAMIGYFVGVTLISIACLALGIVVPITLPFALGAMVLFWVWVLALAAVRRMNISYRLTTQRFFHQTGILTRTTDRIEVIEMDDVTYTQTIFERMFGVGTIKVTSGDPTHPTLIMPGIADVQQVAEIIDKARRKEITRRGLRIQSV